MDRKNRVFLVSGTLQAVIVLSLIEDDKKNIHMYNDYAFITSLSVNINSNNKIIKTITEILSSGSFLRIEDITDIDETVVSLIKLDRIIECENLIKDRFSLEKVHQLFMVDNSKHKTMMMAGRTFDDSYIVNYGDGIGHIRSGIGFGMSHIDEIKTFIPIDLYKGFSQKLPLKIINKNIFFSVAKQFYEKNEQFRNSIKGLRSAIAQNAVLLTTDILSEWRMMDFDKEINMYIKAVIRSCHANNTIVIKQHPRDTTNNRSLMISKILTQRGFNVLCMDAPNLRMMPIELICNFVKFEKAICPLSSSGLTLKYFFGIQTDIGIDDEDINNYKRGILNIKLILSGLNESHSNLDNWKMDGVLYSYEKSPFNYSISPDNMVYITAEEFYRNIVINFYSKKRRLWEFFYIKNIKRVAVYGMGAIGKIIAEDLIDSKELSVYLLDRSLCGQFYMNKEIYSTDSIKQQVDCAIVTLTHSFEEIRTNIKKNMNCEHVFNLKDLCEYPIIKD